MRRGPSASWYSPAPSSLPRLIPCSLRALRVLLPSQHQGTETPWVIQRGVGGHQPGAHAGHPEATPAPLMGTNWVTDASGVGGRRWGHSWRCPVCVTLLPCCFPAGHVPHQRGQRSFCHRLRARVRDPGPGLCQRCQLHAGQRGGEDERGFPQPERPEVKGPREMGPCWAPPRAPQQDEAPAWCRCQRCPCFPAHSPNPRLFLPGARRGNQITAQPCSGPS